MKKIFRKLLSSIFRKYDVLIEKNKRETDALYKLLYNQVHDLDQALLLAAAQTINTFNFQWAELKDGEAMLSDKWYKENVTSIITEQEILINKDWFKGKDVIDCGCGGGRWSYGLATLGANITAVDINGPAIEATKEVLKEFDVKKNFILTPLEELSKHIPDGKKYDLAWSWGVLHHCGSFNTAFRQVMDCVKDGGFIYLYLYGRESLSYNEDIDLFKNRVLYNTLGTWKEKEEFLVEKAHGDRTKIHQNHDIYSPLLNRRLDFDHIKNILEQNGFKDVTRTINSPELHIRAVKTALNPNDKYMLLHPANNTPWYTKYNN
jgi:2-polyprenyl-3-methyl-5-hydroxy-6-metoxy-1,4-benzoquinol methylase